MTILTQQDAIEFALRCAHGAFDQRGEFEDSIASLRENVRDTLADYGVSQYEEAAFAAYDEQIAQLFGESATAKANATAAPRAQYHLSWVDSVSGEAFSVTCSSYRRASKAMRNIAQHGMPVTLTIL